MATASAEQTPPAKQKISAGYYPALDGLRGIAVLAVFFSHFGGGHRSPNALIHLWSIVADAGWMGVDLFFALSGFLITGILYDTSHAAHRAKNFYMRRALRIFPLFYGVLFAFLLLTPVLHLHWRAGHLLYFVYLINMVPVLDPSLPSPGSQMNVLHFWSLAVEEQFYLLFPFLVWFVRERRRLLQVCFVIIACVIALRVGMVVRGVDPEIIYFLLFTRADSLLCGAVLALLVRGPAGQRLPVRWIFPSAAAAVAAMFLVVGNGLHRSALISSIGYTVIGVFCTCMVYCAYAGGNFVARFANHRLFRFFGKYSYGIYVFHGLLIVFLLPLAIPAERLFGSVWLGGAAFLFGSLALSVVLAMLSYHFFESRFLELKRRFT